MESLALLAISRASLAFATVSRRIQGTIIKRPMVYMTLELIMDKLGFGWVEIALDS
jgi:hypothetical protein